MQSFFVDCETEKLIGNFLAETALSPSIHPPLGKRSQGCCVNDTEEKTFVNAFSYTVKRIPSRANANTIVRKWLPQELPSPGGRGLRAGGQKR
jgi:hypothetical protein